ncbi:cupredoxin domain-containing protein [Nitrosopumilus ureiphilus]|uniref:EfeO-type cupredoxin-like domain-containing protein n=1 Tax=Nitrosopumilus ureiphilus TaxID=1470067 RepID=A0A7D5R2D6_9ARCH|nr:cupredoxin domain-containing protein [Nitrosopumilus ureiphilus]QLH07396.1 hypothetical protein C5F50_10185 [Nitrosopumilus ureiphilus]
MVSQGILIGIAVGVFFAGLGIGYTALQSTATPMMMTPQQMQQMMNDPASMNQWHKQMMQNPQAMNQWMGNMMNDPQTMQYMHDMMMSNPQHMNQMMNQMMNPVMNNMMNDPQMQQQMMDMMMNNQEMMNSMMNNPDIMNMMGGNMMGNNMMGGNMMGNNMMGSGMMMGGMSTQSSASLADLQSSTGPQTRTFDIILDEVKFSAEVENEEGQETTSLVELHQWNPNLIVVNEGDTIVLNISNPRKHTHTFTIPEFGVSTKILEPRIGSETIQFVADKAGTFTFSCGLPFNSATGQCDADHPMMTGTLIVLG